MIVVAKQFRIKFFGVWILLFLYALKEDLFAKISEPICL